MRAFSGLVAALVVGGCGASGGGGVPRAAGGALDAGTAVGTADSGTLGMPSAGSDAGMQTGSVADAAAMADADAAQAAAQLGTIANPNPIVSRGRPVQSSAGSSTTVDGNPAPLTSVNDGTFLGGDGFEAPVTSGSAPWVAINVGSGPSRLLLTWLTEGQVDSPYKAPVDYHIDVSADGPKGNWTTVVTVTGNDTNAREDAFDFTGQQWVRIVVDKADSTGDVHFVEIEAYDVSHGSEDTWVFLGDSVTAVSMNRFQTPDFATLIHTAKPSFTPMVIDDAIGGTDTSYALSHIDAWIGRFPDVRNFAVAYGTNDSHCDMTGSGVSSFISNLKMLVDKLKAAGKRVVIPHIPWNSWPGCSGPTLLAPYNAAIDMLRTQDPFVAGPDLYTYFAAHQSQLADGVHPDGDGVAAMNSMWAKSAESLYP